MDEPNRETGGEAPSKLKSQKQKTTKVPETGKNSRRKAKMTDPVQNIPEDLTLKKLATDSGESKKNESSTDLPRSAKRQKIEVAADEPNISNTESTHVNSANIFASGATETQGGNETDIQVPGKLEAKQQKATKVIKSGKDGKAKEKKTDPKPTKPKKSEDLSLNKQKKGGSKKVGKPKMTDPASRKRKKTEDITLKDLASEKEGKRKKTDPAPRKTRKAQDVTLTERQKVLASKESGKRKETHPAPRKTKKTEDGTLTKRQEEPTRRNARK